MLQCWMGGSTMTSGASKSVKSCFLSKQFQGSTQGVNPSKLPERMESGAKTDCKQATPKSADYVIMLFTKIATICIIHQIERCIPNIPKFQTCFFRS